MSQASLLSRSSTQSNSGRGINGIEYSLTGAGGNANYSDSGEHDDEDEIRDLTHMHGGPDGGAASYTNMGNNSIRKPVLHL